MTATMNPKLPRKILILISTSFLVAFIGCWKGTHAITATRCTPINVLETGFSTSKQTLMVSLIIFYLHI
jgi:hypothetical protein